MRVFQSCGFNCHRVCTGNCDGKDFRSLLLWFPEITSSPRRTFTLPLFWSLGTDCWARGEEEQGSNGAYPPCGDQAGCAKEKGFTYSQQERSPQLGLTRALWL